MPTIDAMSDVFMIQIGENIACVQIVLLSTAKDDERKMLGGRSSIFLRVSNIFRNAWSSTDKLTYPSKESMSKPNEPTKEHRNESLNSQTRHMYGITAFYK